MVSLLASPGGAGWRSKKSDEKRKKIDAVAEETMAKLFEVNPEAKDLYDTAYGWAVFDSRQTKLLVSGGGGVGVAVEPTAGKRTYMRTASIGVGIGLGIQFYQVVFLFETAEVMRNFVENGWEVGGGANAVAGDEGTNLHVTATDTDQIAAGANASAGYADGIAVFQFTEKGYMLQADISGTKYWKDKKLNDH
jgi:lipid-binding SYLF domain-containing protein